VADKLSSKDRMKIPRQEMPAQTPEERAKNFNEVPFGLPAEIAIMEASRCLDCPKPKCMEGCPVEVDIPGFIRLIMDGRYSAAARKIKETNALPAVCGRVCPQDEQCEKLCVLGKKLRPVAIGNLERFLADWERDHGEVEAPAVAAPTGKRAAVVGSGPSGITVAADLAKLGHKVTMFEALHKPGGVLIYGIPEFRLPKSIVAAEVDVLRQMGVEIVTSFVVGKLDTIDELFEDGYDAVFVGTGAGLPNFMRIPGENLKGIYSANEYLTRANLMKAYRFPEYDPPIALGRRVATVGGGNVAMDSARTALRLGAAESLIVYRRSREEMPCREEEIHHAVQEGVQLNLLVTPVALHGDKNGWVKELECLRNELGEPDASGRRRPVPIPDSNFRIPVDIVVMAIGQSPNPLIPKTTPGLETGRGDVVLVDQATMKTSKKGVFAGGDVATGGATVILAMGQGKIAARAIDAYLRTGEW